MARMYLSDFDNLRPQEPQAPQTEDNFLDSVTSGFKSGAAGVVGGITNLLPENPVSDWFDEVEKANQRKRNFDTIFSLDYLTSPSGAAYDVANQLGSMAALAPAAYFAPEGAVAGILGKVGSKLLPLFGSTMGKWGASQMAKYAMGESSALANAIRWGFTSIPEALSEAGQTNKEARDAGYDDNYTRAAKTFAANMAVLPLSNTLEGALLGGALFRPSAAVGESFAKRAAMAPVRMAPSVIAEGIQNGSEEAAQQMAQNLAMDRPLMEGVREAAEVGAFGSMVLGGLGGGARAMTVNNDGEESGRSYNQVDEGLQKSFDLYGGQRMPNGENGCVEAVVRLGQTYSKFLHDEFENGTARVGTLVEHAQNDNIPVVPFSEAALQKGDVIVYFQPEDSTDNVDDGEHVVIYDGQGGYVGNSSSQQKIVQNEDYTSMSGLVPKLIIKTGGQSTGASISSSASQDTAPALPSNFDANAFISSAHDFVESHYEDDTPDTLASRTDYFRNMFEDAEKGKMPTQEQMQEAVSAYPRLGEMLQQEAAPSMPQQQEAPKENREAPATPDITIETDNISRARETQTQNAADNFTPTTPAEVQAPVTQGAAVPQAPVAHGMTALTGPQSAGQEAARQRNEEATARQEGLAQAQAVQQQNALVAEGNQFADAARQIGFPVQPETEAALRRGDPAAINMARQLVSTMQNGGVQNANQLPAQNISSAPAQSGETGVNQNQNAQPQPSAAESQQAQIIDQPIPGYPPKMTYRRHAEAAAKRGALYQTEDGQNILRAEEAGNVVDIPVPQEVADYYNKLKNEKKSKAKAKPAAQEKAQRENKPERKETIAEEKKVAQNGSDEAREAETSKTQAEKSGEQSAPEQKPQKQKKKEENTPEKASAAERYIDKVFPAKGSHMAATKNEVAKLAMYVNPNNWVDGLKDVRADYKKQIDKILQPAIEALQKGFGNKVKTYQDPDTGRWLRETTNAQWYREFFAEHKRQPNKSELREMARQLILGDANAPQVEGWTATSKDVADKIKEDGKRLVDLEQHLKACDAIKPKLAEAQKAFKAQQRVASKPRTFKQRLTSAIDRFLQSAWHGSRALFNEFDLSFLGTGEGAQAHGWGLYFAENRKVAEAYREALSATTVDKIYLNGEAEPYIKKDLDDADSMFDWEYMGKEVDYNSDKYWALYELARAKGNKEKAIESLKEAMAGHELRGYTDSAATVAKSIRFIENLNDIKYEREENEGALYHVEIPSTDVLLDEQKTFEDQPEKVQESLKKLIQDYSNSYHVVKEGDSYVLYDGDRKASLSGYESQDQAERMAELNNEQKRKRVEQRLPNLSQLTGREIYKGLSRILPGDARAASELLNQYGIEGITYDGQQDGRCYVIFNDKAISILDRFEQEANQQGKGEYDIINRLISIFKSADASTVPHELSHWFTAEQEEIAAIIPNSKIAQNLKALYDWADWKEGDAKAFKGSATEEEFAEYEKNILDAQKNKDEKAELYWKGVWRQEKIARAFEDYLKKGKAPTKGLKGIFARFKHWLEQIYRDLVGADIEPSKAVKQFFDSVLATEDEIRTGEDMIMTPGEQEAYDTMKAKLSEDGKLSEEDELAAALAARIAYRMSLTWRVAGEEKSAVSLLPGIVRGEDEAAVARKEFERQKAEVRKKYQGTKGWLKAPNGEDTNLTEEQWVTVRTENFIRWFGDWINDPENASKVVDENGEPKVVYHGTVSGWFNTFKKEYGNVEGDMGARFYFTDNKDDVTRHYEDGGPDFENKVERLAERIQQDEDISYDEAYDKAREQLYNESALYDVFLNIKNPANVQTTRLFTDEVEAEDVSREDYDTEDEYYEAQQEAQDDAWGDTIESIVDRVSAEGYDADRGALSNILYEAMYEGGIKVEDLRKKLNDLYIEDDEGNLASNEVMRLVIEELGYDGIIDPTVSTKFKRMELVPDTTHYIAFNSEQIKSSTENNGQFSRKDGNIYHQFAGKNAKTADKMKLAEAERMEADGATKKDIYKKTGWFKGKDDEWRFEIKDNLDKINFKGLAGKKSVKLSEIYDNPDLYKAYPWLKQVIVKPTPKAPTKLGSYSLGDNSIEINKNLLKNNPGRAKKTLVHEIQHAIQYREKFAKGGNSERSGGYDNYRRLGGEQEARETANRAAIQSAIAQTERDIEAAKGDEKKLKQAQFRKRMLERQLGDMPTPHGEDAIIVFDGKDMPYSVSDNEDMASPIKQDERPTEIQVPEEYNNNRNIKELYNTLNDERMWNRIKDDMTPGDVFNALTTQHRSDIAKLDSYLDRLGKSDAPPQQIETTRNLLETALRNLIEKGEVFNGEYFRRALVRFARSTDGRRKGNRLAESLGNGRLETFGRRYKLPNGQRIMSLPHEAEFKSERINSILEKIEAEGRPERGGHFIGRNSLDTEAFDRSKEELRNEIVEAFPGAKVKDNGDHLTLTMPNGAEIAVDLVDKIVTSEDELARAKEEHGLDQGTEATVGGTARALDNKAFVELAKTSHKGTGFHEAFHLAYDMVLNDKEKAAIKKAYDREGKGGKSFDEWTADEYARWKQERLAGRGTSLGKLWQKITDFARKMKALFAGDTMQDVFRKVEQGEVWKREAQKGTGEVHHSIERANKLDQDNVNKAAKNAASRIEVRENKKKGAMSLGDRYLWSPSRIAKRHPEFKPFFDFADKAMKKLTKLREEWGAALSSALDMAKDKEGRQTLYDILWQGDAEGKEYSDAELREMGANDDVIKAYKSIRSIMDKVYDALNDARRRPQVKTRTMSESSLEDLKNNKFVIKILSDEKQSDGKHKVTWREYQNWERDAVVDKETYDKFKKDPAIQILSEEKLGDNSYALHYRESISPLTDRKGYIPHFFHNFRVILSSAEEQKMIVKRDELYKKLDKAEGQKEKNAIQKEIDKLTDEIDAAREENTDSILGSFRTLGDAMDYAKNHEKELPEGAKLIISPKTFNFKALGQDGKMLAAVLGDKDYDKVMRSIAANTDLTVAEAREVIDARKKGRHRFNGNFLQRKGYSGFVKDMEWVLRHHINSSARYVAMETEFKPKAINLFERMYGDFDKHHEGIADYTRDYINDVNGVPSNLEKAISDTLNNWSWWRNHVASNFGERAALQLAGNVSGAVSIAKLGMLNVSSAMINLTQLANAAAYIGDWNVLWNGLRRGAKGIYGKYSDKDQRVLDETGVAYDIGLDSGGGYDKFRPGDLAAKSMWFFKTSEETVRRGTVLAAYDAGIKRGMSHEEAIRFAEEVNRKSNFEYGVQDAPNVFRRGSIISQLLLQFKKYPIKELEVMSDMLSQQTNAKQKAIFWGTYFMLAGLFQVPFGDWFEELAELIGLKPGPTLRKWMMTAAGDDPMKQTLAKMAMYGVGAGMNVDISQRYGLGGVLPTDLYLGKNPSSLDLVGSLGGATVSTVRDLYRLIGAAARLDSDAAIASLRGISPGVANAVSAYNGKTYDKRGRVATEYNTPRDRILKALGFRSADEAAVSDIRSIYYDEKEEKTQEKQRAIDKYLNEPTTENAKRLKELGVKPATVKKARQQRKLDNLHRTEANMSKKERKEYQELLKFTK